MLDRLRSHSFSYQAPVLVCLLAILLLLVLPTGFEGALIYQEAERCTARVLETDNSAIIDTGLVRSGEQRCQLEILDGRFQGRTVTGINMLNGSLEQDKLFSPGDRAQVVVSHDGDTITNVTMSDHYRLGWETLMAAGFALFLILFAGRTGVRAIASFVLTVLCLWKLLVPLYLKGWNPIWGGLAITLFLTILIIALVYGFDRRCWAAVSGSFLGILVTCVLGILFTDLFQIHGAVMSYSDVYKRQMYARGCLVGLTRGTTREHIIRAAQESIAYQSWDLVRAMEQDTGLPLAELRVDGGASRDRFLMQFQADILDKPVRRPMIRETTALGAAYLAGLAVGVWDSLDEIRAQWTLDRLYQPQMEEPVRRSLLAGWHKAVGRSLNWAEPET